MYDPVSRAVFFGSGSVSQLLWGLLACEEFVARAADVADHDGNNALMVLCSYGRRGWEFARALLSGPAYAKKENNGAKKRK